MEKQLASPTDNDLIREFQTGNNAVFDVIFTRYRNSVRTNILIITKDSDLADDLTQDVFLKAFERLQDHTKQHDSKGSLLAWLQRMAYNMCIDQFRKSRRKPFMFPIEHLTTDEDLVTKDSGQNAEELQINGEWRELIRACIKDLPEEQKELILLRVYGGMKFKEIAGLTGISINTLVGRMRYALHHLKQDVQKSEPMTLSIAS